MSVEIDLELDANGATGKIGAVAASLKGLERVANDIDIDFDADVGDITQQLEEFSDALGDLDTKNLQIVDDLDTVADKLDDSLDQEIDLNVKGDGESNSGRSTGGDPPAGLVHKLSAFGDGGATNTGQSAAEATDGGSVANLYERTYGPDATLMSNEDVGNLFKTRNSRTSNLGTNAPGFEEFAELKRIGKRSGFGNDPVSMDMRRDDFNVGLSDDFDFTLEELGGELTFEEFKKGADPTDKPRSRTPLQVDTAKYANTQELIEDIADSKAQAQFDALAGDTDTFRDQGLNDNLRESELSASELADIHSRAASMPDSDLSDLDMRTPLRHRIEEIARSQAEKRAELIENVRNDDFFGNESDYATGYTKEKRKEELSPVEKAAIYRQASNIGDIPQSDGSRKFPLGEQMRFARVMDDIPDMDLRSADRLGLFGDESPLEPGRFSTGEMASYAKKVNDGKFPDTDLRDVDKEARNSAFKGPFNRGLLNRMGYDPDKGKAGNIREMNDSLGNKLRNLKPTMGKYMQLLAAFLPIAVALGTQLLGVAAAMGSVAVAGGAIMALGLLGHGDNMADSFAQAKLQLRDLKREMFEVAQPTMQQFAPIQERMFESIPGALEGPLQEMQGFTQFEDTLFAMGGDLAGGIEEFFAIINRNGDAVSQLSRRFGGLLGAGLLNFFEWLIQSASRNQDLLVSLGRDMLKLVSVAYSLSMAVAKIVTAFTPLINFMVWLSNLMNGAILVGLIAMIGYLFLLGKAAFAVYALGSAFVALKTFLVAANVPLITYIANTWGAVAATMALVTAIGLLTGGTALAVGAIGAGAAATMTPDVPSGRSGGGAVGAGGGTTINNNQTLNFEGGSGDYATKKGVEDQWVRMNESEAGQQLPEANASSESTSGNSSR
jgi:hypothetical protein